MSPEDFAEVTGSTQIQGTEGADQISTDDNRAPSGDDLILAGGETMHLFGIERIEVY